MKPSWRGPSWSAPRSSPARTPRRRRASAPSSGPAAVAVSKGSDADRNATPAPSSSSSTFARPLVDLASRSTLNTAEARRVAASPSERLLKPGALEGLSAYLIDVAARQPPPVLAEDVGVQAVGLRFQGERLPLLVGGDPAVGATFMISWPPGSCWLPSFGSGSDAFDIRVQPRPL